MAGMRVFLLLAGCATVASASEQKPQSYKTAKTLPVLEKCLVQELSDLGEPTLMQEKGSTTLMIRNGEGRPLLIEITPPSVTITTKADLETRNRVGHCL
jgi:hypothetical protein